MFRSQNEDDYADVNSAEDTIIGGAIKIEGDLISNGSISVEGEVVGSIKTEKTLKVGEKAKIVASIKAHDAFISGKVEGNVAVQDKLELAGTAEVNGDIEAKTLNIVAGAVFNGKCSMSGNSVQGKEENKKSDNDPMKENF